jgi:hypothetical protein
MRTEAMAQVGKVPFERGADIITQQDQVDRELLENISHAVGVDHKLGGIMDKLKWPPSLPREKRRHESIFLGLKSGNESSQNSPH